MWGRWKDPMGNRGGLTLYQLQPGFIIQQFMPEGYRARAKMHAEKKMFKGVRKIWNASRICVSSLRRGHANLLCIVPILVYVTEVTSIPQAPSLYILAQLSRKKQICTLRSIQPPIWSPLFIILDWWLQLSSWFWELLSFTNFFNILIKAQDWICS